MIMLDARVLIIIFRRFLVAAFGAIAYMCVHFLVTACEVTYTAEFFFLFGQLRRGEMIQKAADNTFCACVASSMLA